MPAPLEQSLDILRAHVRVATDNAHVPFSEQPVAALALLSDGIWVPGVRVESASFSLTIPALLNAITTAIAAEREDIVAVVSSRPLSLGEVALLNQSPFGSMMPVADDTYVLQGLPRLPIPSTSLTPFLTVPPPNNAEAGVQLARQVAARAFIPVSHFPVGCVLETDDGRLLPGVNVEHPDWSRILCAERNALGTAISYGEASSFGRLYLSCPQEPAGTPCGACRQLLAELAPAIVLWMDRGPASPETTRPEALLPGFFNGQAFRSDR